MICEESSTNANSNQVILDVCPMMKGKKKKIKKPRANARKRSPNIAKTPSRREVILKPE
jgi:hypothetical protein